MPLTMFAPGGGTSSTYVPVHFQDAISASMATTETAKQRTGAAEQCHQQLQHLQQLQHPQQLQHLQRLQHLQHLQHLQDLQQHHHQPQQLQYSQYEHLRDQRHLEKNHQ
ncbi:unnamed protein product [Closterium sp. NIES-53]